MSNFISFKNKILILLLLAFIPSTLLAQRGKDDTQLWSETWIYAPKFTESFDMGYTNYSRFGRDVSKVTDERQAVFATYTLMPELKFTQHLAYIEQHRPNASSDGTIQIRPMTDAHGIFDLDFIRFTYRLRAERQHRYDYRDRWNFRPRFGFEIPFTFGDYKPYLFANFEPFYTSDTDEWYRLRNLYGIGSPITKHVSLDLYVGQQLQRNPAQTDYEMVGFILKIKP